MKRTKLLLYTVKGTQVRYGACDVPNADYLSELYVCAECLRDAANLIRQHAPREEIGVVEISHSTRGWPPSMAFVKPARGVWGSKHPNGVTVFKLTDGELNELD